MPKLRNPTFLALAATTVLIGGGASIYYLLTRPLPFDAEVWAEESSWQQPAYRDWLGLPTQRQRMVEDLRSHYLPKGMSLKAVKQMLGEGDADQHGVLSFYVLNSAGPGGHEKLLVMEQEFDGRVWSAGVTRLLDVPLPE